ncbi:MAG: hypothetical protein K2N07_01885 [Desulfovibrio sp.]|nr:hypothetical protein [Desulfovibrio sp.]
MEKTWIDEVDFKKLSCPDLQGFGCCYTVKELVDEGKMAKIPKKNGVYLILAPDAEKPEFTEDVKAVFFNENGVEPKSKTVLDGQWIDGTRVLYIGKAGVLHGKGASNLRTRLRAYMRWYKGAKNSHHGGRDIWQIKEPEKLLVTWRVTENEDPRQCEEKLLARFKATCGQPDKPFPFANHQS